jgi:hypothetical protein
MDCLVLLPLGAAVAGAAATRDSASTAASATTDFMGWGSWAGGGASGRSGRAGRTVDKTTLRPTQGYDTTHRTRGTPVGVPLVGDMGSGHFVKWKSAVWEVPSFSMTVS